jgi:hypothetical protein
VEPFVVQYLACTFSCQRFNAVPGELIATTWESLKRQPQRSSSASMQFRFKLFGRYPLRSVVKPRAELSFEDRVSARMNESIDDRLNCGFFHG